MVPEVINQDAQDLNNTTAQAQCELNDAKTAIMMGAGVGAVGTASALLVGATCPICVVMAPALIGMGLIRGYAAKKKLREKQSKEAS